MFEYEQFNIAPWGGEIAIYFFLIGTAAMVFVYSVAPVVFGKMFGGAAQSMESFQKPGLVVALILLLICGPLLIEDLGQPSRFLYPILHFHWTSPLSWGSLFLPLFGLSIVGFFFGHMKDNQQLMKLTGVLGTLLALSMPLYTGLDLMVHQGRELWANPTIPVLFVILSISSGTALTSVIQLVRGKITEQAAEFMHLFLYIAVGVTLALFLGLVVTLMYGTAELQQAWAIINSDYGMEFWGLTFVVGILVPLAIVAPHNLGRNPMMLTVAGVLSAVGAYTFREVLINVGQLTQLYY